jgi:biopolymer transport protein ExbB/TolQ
LYRLSDFIARNDNLHSRRFGKTDSFNCNGCTDFGDSESSSAGEAYAAASDERIDHPSKGLPNVARRNERNSLFVILSSIGWPLLLGSAGSTLFYVLVFRGPLDVPAMHRYFATHPVSYVATVMFFVGLAALCLKLLDVLGQYAGLNGSRLEETPPSGQKVEDARRLLDDLASSSASARSSYLGRRLRDALRFVTRKGSADGLDDELKYLADMDAVRQHDSYALIRIIIWATPMLGFLGTVIGITQALGDLDPKQLATDIQGAMEGLLAGLYIAFDTTALALSLSIVLMFIQFLVDRIETQLLATVDVRANEQLVGRFQQIGAGNDPHLASVERMCNEILKATQRLVGRQAKLWQTTIDAAHDRWSTLSTATGQQLQAALAGALEQTLVKHAAGVAKVEQAGAEQARRRWEQLQTAISDNARMMQAQQEEMIKQGEIMAKAVQATGDVIRLEESLNENLRALAGAKNFEDMVMSLSAAIHLLCARLDGPTGDVRQVDLTESSAKGRAA